MKSQQANVFITPILFSVFAIGCLQFPSNQEQGSLSERALKASFRLQYSQADSLYLAASDSASTEGNNDLVQRMMIARGELLLGQGKFIEAKTLFLQLVSSVENENVTHHSLSLGNCYLAEIAIRTGAFFKADNYLKECWYFMPSLEKDRIDIEPYYFHTLGFLHHQQAQFDQALEYYDIAVSKYSLDDTNRTLAYTNTLNNIGNVYYRMGLYDQAEDMHSDNVIVRSSFLPSNHPKIAGSIGNLGIVYFAKGQYNKALQYQFRSLDIWRNSGRIEDLSIALTYDNIGQSYSASGDFVNALSYLNKSLVIKSNYLSEHHPSKATTYCHLASTLLSLGDLRSAEDAINIALSILESENLTSKPLYVLAIGTKAKLLALRGRVAEATALITHAYEISSHQSHPVFAKVLNHKADICLEHRLYDCAVETAHTALYTILGAPGFKNERFSAIRLDYKNAESLLSSLNLKGKALFQRGLSLSSEIDLNASFDSYERAVRLISKIYRSGSHYDESYLPVYQNEVIQGALMVGLELIDRSDNSDEIIKRMFSIVDDSRSSGIVDKRQRETFIGHRTATQRQGPFQTKDVDDTVIVRDPKASTSSLSPHKFDRSSYNHTPFSLVSSIIVKDGYSLIEYFEIQDDIYAFIIKDKSIHLMRIGPSIEVAHLTNKLRVAYEQSTAADILKYSFSLYNLLLFPMMDIIGEDDLIIIPNQSLSSISFEALTTSPVDSLEDSTRFDAFPFLIKDRTVTYGFAASLLMMQSYPKQKLFNNDLLAFAPVFDIYVQYSQVVASFVNRNSSAQVFDGYNLLPPLPGSEREVKSIASILKWKDGWKGVFTSPPSDVLLREESTEHRLKSTDLTQYRYLHFATHSFADKNNPAESGIILETSGSDGEDGILHAHEIFDLNLNAELVVLSSCDTAKDAANDNSGLSGFAKGFIYAGARNLVASLWPSDDVGTQILMQEFYQELAKGLSSDVALRNAKLNLINSKGPIAKPYYWSGFIHIGPPGASETAP